MTLRKRPWHVHRMHGAVYCEPVESPAVSLSKPVPRRRDCNCGHDGACPSESRISEGAGPLAPRLQLRARLCWPAECPSESRISEGAGPLAPRLQLRVRLCWPAECPSESRISEGAGPSALRLQLRARLCWPAECPSESRISEGAGPSAPRLQVSLHPVLVPGCVSSAIPDRLKGSN